MPVSFPHRSWRIATLLAILAGLIYSSWPLSYLLNPALNHGLASDLEASGQPYNWLFVVLDVVCGVLICGLSLWLLRQSRHMRKILKLSLIGFGLFGLFTIVDALVPLDCVPVLKHHCAQTFDDPWTVSHGLFNFGSLVGLTASIIGTWWLLIHKHRAKLGLKWLMDSTVLTWFGLGVYSLVLVALVRYDALTQHIFIFVCSLWTAIVPYMTWQLIADKSSTRS